VDALTAGPGNVLYAGGSFDWLAMPTGHLAWFDASVRVMRRGLMSTA
jgi:hypothetical protein